MKNLFYSLLSFIIIAGVSGAHAETMCVRDDTVAVVLSDNIYGAAKIKDTVNMRWTVALSSDSPGTIVGVASCNETSGSLNTVSDSKFSVGVTGGNCWCRMEKPAISKWIWRGAHGQNPLSQCRAFCAGWCAELGNQNQTDYRKVMFNNIVY